MIALSNLALAGLWVAGWIAASAALAVLFGLARNVEPDTPPAPPTPAERFRRLDFRETIESRLPDPPHPATFTLDDETVAALVTLSALNGDDPTVAAALERTVESFLFAPDYVMCVWCRAWAGPDGTPDEPGTLGDHLTTCGKAPTSAVRVWAELRADGTIQPDPPVDLCGGLLGCDLPAGHEGPHRFSGGVQGSAMTPDPAVWICGAAYGTTDPDVTLTCRRPPGHDGVHRDDAPPASWGAEAVEWPDR